ncbi:MAG: ABC transporter permease [Syntrophomonadaceae bacterium]|nr:ABC transporter permease [Syntrophomonadaceae bacterium]
MYNIIRLTLKEIINKRILHLGVVLSIVYLLIYGISLHYLVKDLAYMNSNQFWYKQQIGYQILTLGWYVSSFLLGALSIMMGAGSISGEIESGTILSLASRPFHRRTILLGKFLAYSLVTALYSGILVSTIVFLVNYYFKLSISFETILAGILLFTLFPIVLLAVAHLASVLVSTLAAGVITFMLFIIGIIGGFMEQIGVMINNIALMNTGVVSSLLIPCDAIYRMAVAKMAGTVGGGFIVNFGPFGVSSEPSIWMLVYALAYITSLILLALHFFAKRDF